MTGCLKEGDAIVDTTSCEDALHKAVSIRGLQEPELPLKRETKKDK